MPRSARPTTVFPISPIRELEVVRVEDVTPGMRRVVLGGEHLLEGPPVDGTTRHAFVSPGFDDSIRLFFPYPGQARPVLPIIKDGKAKFPTDPRPLSKVYTVRSYDPAAGEMVVDFVKHGVGVATTWAYRAQPGDTVHVGGPLAADGFPEGFDWWLVVGDDTALPAIARMLEEMPEDTRAQVFIEMSEASHRHELRQLPGVVVTWLFRGGEGAATSTQLLDAVRAADWWDGEAFAWLAGEQSIVRDLRRHLVEARELPKTSIDFTGYWKRAEVVALADDEAMPDPDKNDPAFEKFHELAEIIPPVAIRVALDLGIGDLISRGVTSIAELARRTGSDPRALGKLLRYLQAIELLEQPTPGNYALTEVGDYLAVQFVIDHMRVGGWHRIQEDSVLGLAESIRTGKAAYPGMAGQTFKALRDDPEFEHGFLEDAAQYAGYAAAPLAASRALEGIEHLVIRSDAPNVDAREITARHSNTNVTISTTGVRAEWLRADLPTTIASAVQRDRIDYVVQSLFDEPPAADAVALVQQLGQLGDEDAAAALRAAAANLRAGGRIVLVEHTLDTEELDEHDGEHDLMSLAAEGTGLRTPEELEAVVGAAGLTVARVSTIGWGTKVRELSK